MLSNYKKLNLSDYSDVQDEAAGVFEGVAATIQGDEVIVRKQSEDDYDQEGDVKVSWEYVPAGDKYTIFAQ